MKEPFIIVTGVKDQEGSDTIVLHSGEIISKEDGKVTIRGEFPLPMCSLEGGVNLVNAMRNALSKKG